MEFDLKHPIIRGLAQGFTMLFILKLLIVTFGFYFLHNHIKRTILKIFDKEKSFCQANININQANDLCDSGSIFKVNSVAYDEISNVLKHPYFRYFKIDLDKECPFWSEPKRCFDQHCVVNTIKEVNNNTYLG